jgi:hypothetical protein
LSKDGALLEGNATVSFQLFDAQTAGNIVWPTPPVSAESFDIVAIGGKFSVALGSTLGKELSSAVFDGSMRWLQITIDDGSGPSTLSPRVAVHTVPYAFRAEEAESLPGLPPADIATTGELAALQGQVDALSTSASSAHTDWANIENRPSDIDDGDDDTKPLADCGADLLTWNGLAFVCVPDGDTVPGATCEAGSALTWDGNQFGCADIVTLIGPHYTHGAAIAAVGAHFSGSYDDLSSVPWTKSGGDISHTGGAVGVGTTTPGAQLHVAGAGGRVNPTGACPALPGICDCGMGTTWYDDVTADGLVENGECEVNGLVIEGGNVGLSVSAPQYPLHVEGGSIADQPVLYVRNDIDSGSHGTLTLDTAYDRDVGIALANQGVVKWRLLNDGPTAITGDTFNIRSEGGTARMAIAQDGNVGIGTATPTQKLDVQGFIRSSQPISFATSHTLPTKVTILAGATYTFNETTEFPPHMWPRSTYRYVLWVNVAGDPNVTQTTTVTIERQHIGCSCGWVTDTDIGSWTISGRDWGDNYVDQNISRSSSASLSFKARGLRMTNTGTQNLEIFAVGIIQESWDTVNAYVQP